VDNFPFNSAFSAISRLRANKLTDFRSIFLTETKYQGNARSIGEIDKEVESNGRVYTFTPFMKEGDNLTTIGYKLFTDKPLWILTRRPERIDEALTKFSLSEFLTSYQFEITLGRHIKSKNLDDAFILETLGQPTKRTKYF